VLFGGGGGPPEIGANPFFHKKIIPFRSSIFMG